MSCRSSSGRSWSACSPPSSRRGRRWRSVPCSPRSFVVWFALHPTVAAAVHHAPAGTATRSPWTPYVFLLAGAMLLVGGVFGSILTALTEFLRLRGLESQTGIVYGAMSAGAIIVAVGAAALPRRFTLGARWAVFAAIGLVGAVAAGTQRLGAARRAGPVPQRMRRRRLARRAVQLRRARGAAADARPRCSPRCRARSIVGQAAAAAAGGLVAQTYGPATGFWITTALVAGLLVLAFVNRRRARRYDGRHAATVRWPNAGGQRDLGDVGGLAVDLGGLGEHHAAGRWR